MRCGAFFLRRPAGHGVSKVARGSNLARAAGELITNNGPSEEEEITPLDDYKDLKEDAFASQGLLSLSEVVVRVAGVFTGVFVLMLPTTTAIYPPVVDGIANVNNLGASVLFAASAASFVIFLVVLNVTQAIDDVNKSLQRASFYVEYDGTTGMGYDSGPAGAYSYTRTKSEKQLKQDRLLANTETEPALSRLRVILLGSVVATGFSFGVGSVCGGEMALAPKEVEEAPSVPQDGVVTYKAKKKKCGSGCMPGLDDN